MAPVATSFTVVMTLGGWASGTVLELLFEGLNEADSNKPVIVNIWKADVPSADQVQLIGDDLGKFDFKAECLKDSTKGAGASAFYRALLL